MHLGSLEVAITWENVKFVQNAISSVLNAAQFLCNDLYVLCCYSTHGRDICKIQTYLKSWHYEENICVCFNHILQKQVPQKWEIPKLDQNSIDPMFWPGFCNLWSLVRIIKRAPRKKSFYIYYFWTKAKGKLDLVREVIRKTHPKL